MDNRIHADHLSAALQPGGLKKILNQAIKRLRPHQHKFDAIAMRGWSGSLVGPTLCYLLKKTPIVVRKEPGHSMPNGSLGVIGAYADRYIIVDDFVSSGGTLRAIVNAVETSKVKRLTGPGSPELVAVYMWRVGDEPGEQVISWQYAVPSNTASDRRITVPKW